MAPRSPASSMRARMPVRVPGAGSSTSVRSWRRVLSRRRYCTSSAWHRRQASTWRSTADSAVAPPSTIWGSTSTTWSHCTLLLLSTHREQALPQLATGPVEPDLGRRLGDAELSRDLLVGEVVDVTEDDHRPQPVRQFLEGGGDPLAVQGGVGPGLGVGLEALVDERGLLGELLVAVLAPLHE